MRSGQATDPREAPYSRTTLFFLLRDITSFFGVVTSHSVIVDSNAEGRQRARRTPCAFPLLDLEVLSTDVDGVGSLMDGMTIVPSVPSVRSLASATTSTSMIGASHPFASRSGGPRSDTMSVLLALTAPPALSGWTVFGSRGAGSIGVTVVGEQSNIRGGGGKNSACIPRCLELVSSFW